MRNDRPRAQVPSDDDLDASLAPHGRGTADFGPSGGSAQPALDMADDDDLDALFLATMVGAPTSVHQRSIEDRLESLFSRGWDLANTLVRPEENIDDMGSVAATEALKRQILSLVPAWHNRQVALGALAVFHSRPTDHTPVEEVNLLWALEGNSFIRAHGVVLFTYHGFP